MYRGTGLVGLVGGRIRAVNRRPRAGGGEDVLLAQTHVHGRDWCLPIRCYCTQSYCRQRAAYVRGTGDLGSSYVLHWLSGTDRDVIGSL